MVPKTEMPARDLASAGSLPCNVQAHRPMTVSPANPAATDTSPTRTKTSRPRLVHHAAYPPAHRFPVTRIEYVNCGKVGTACRKIIAWMTLVSAGLLMIVARKQHFRDGRPGHRGSDHSALGALLLSRLAVGRAYSPNRPSRKGRGRPPRIHRSRPSSATRRRGRETSAVQRDRRIAPLAVRNEPPSQDTGLDYDATCPCGALAT